MGVIARVVSVAALVCPDRAARRAHRGRGTTGALPRDIQRRRTGHRRLVTPRCAADLWQLLASGVPTVKGG